MGSGTGWPRRFERLLPGLSVALAAAFALGMDVTLCPLAGLFGIPCPSCGLTRATLALLRGNLSHAQAIHPAVVPVLLYVAAAAIVFTRSLGRRVRRLIAVLGIVLVAAMLVLWGARFSGALGGAVPVERWQ